MALSPTALAELREELETLLRMRVQIDERTKALEAILSPLDLGQTMPFRSASSAAADLVLTATNGNRYVRPASANNGLRVAALRVLKKHGPSRAPSIAKYMVEDGWMEDGSSTPLPIRVYNDLWRLSRKGEVQKNSDGVFALR